MFYNIVHMPRGFDIGREWETHGFECPSCGQQFAKEWEDGDPPVLHREFIEEASDHGEYIEVRCRQCETPVQRHYPDAEVSQQEDPLVEPSGWVQRAEELHTLTTLRRRESHVQALKERGKSTNEIADILDIEPSTVREYARRIDQRFSEAEHTLKLPDQRLDIGGILNATIDGVLISPISSEVCSECSDDLKPGDRAMVPLEWGSNGWKALNMYCIPCSDGDLHHQAGGKVELNEFLEDVQAGGIPCAVAEGTLEQIEKHNVPSHQRTKRHTPMGLRDPAVQLFYPDL